jgi:hypothetical protein
MSWGAICWVISAVIFFALGFDLVNSTGKVDLVLLAAGLVPAGLVLSGYTVPLFGAKG